MVIVMIVLGSNILLSQSVKVGLRIEPGILFSEQFNQSEINPVFYSVSANIIYEPIKWLGLEIRPGYVSNGEYGGYEIGGFARIKILPTNIFLLIGMNNHSNNISNAHNGGGSYVKEMLYKGIGVGYQKDSKLSFDIMYYWTNNRDYAYSRVTDWQSYSRIVNKQMNGILKLGFNISFTVI